jgi:raffinose/stachyose/melibiose transport system permease protein
MSATTTTTRAEVTGSPRSIATPTRHRVDPIYWLFLLPAIAIFTLLITVPAVIGFTLSFTNSIGFGDFDWIGFNNYIALFRDEGILASYGFTLGFAAVTVVLVNVIAFALALGLTSKVKFQTALRTVFVIPMVISAIIIAYVFQFLFSNSVPLLGQALRFEPLAASILADPDLAWLAIVIVTAWGAIPGAMLIYIAGLMTVPSEVYEASSIDGASSWQNLWRITLPLVSGYVVINVILGFKGYLGVYDQIVGLTGGGPGIATRSVAMTIFSGFGGGDYAYQMANAAVFFLITIVIALLQMRVTRGRATFGS